MNSIKVSKSVLLQKLRENRAAHNAEYQDARAGYLLKVKSALKEKLQEIADNKLPNLSFGLPAPVDQTKTYDIAIGMLEMASDLEVELEEHDYRQYVLDEWTWSTTAKLTNSFYSGTIS